MTSRGEKKVLRLRLKEPIDDDSLIFCGIEFQTVGAANLKALRPTALVVKDVLIVAIAGRDGTNAASACTISHEAKSADGRTNRA